MPADINTSGSTSITVIFSNMFKHTYYGNHIV